MCVRLGVHARVRVRLCVRSLAEKRATVLRLAKYFTTDKNLVGRGGGGTTLGSKEEN